MDFTGKYKIGDRVALKIGERPVMHFAVVGCVMRKEPHYCLDWAEHGFNAILNTVAIPEKSVLVEQ